MNYKEALISGSEYRRAKKITIINNLNDPPAMIFSEEKVTSLSSGEVIHNDTDQLRVDYNPSDTIVLIDGTTGLATGQLMTHALLYQAIHSIYMGAATVRDASI